MLEAKRLLNPLLAAALGINLVAGGLVVHRLLTQTAPTARARHAAATRELRRRALESAPVVAPAIRHHDALQRQIDPAGAPDAAERERRHLRAIVAAALDRRETTAAADRTEAAGEDGAAGLDRDAPTPPTPADGGDFFPAADPKQRRALRDARDSAPGTRFPPQPIDYAEGADHPERIRPVEGARDSMIITAAGAAFGFQLDPADYRQGTCLLSNLSGGDYTLRIHGDPAAVLVDGRQIDSELLPVGEGTTIQAVSPVHISVRPGTVPEPEAPVGDG